MANPSQKSSPATALPMLVTKQTSSLSITSYIPWFVASRNNVLIIDGDMKAQIGKNVNNKFSLHNSSNRNGEHLTDFVLENRLTYLNTKFQKRKGKLWTNTDANNAKAQIDILINKKWNNSALNFEAYSSFEGESSDHHFVTARIRLCLRRNAARTTTTAHYNWSQPNNNRI